MTKPSSTITAATLAGITMGVVWGGVKTFFPEISFDPTLISGSTTLAAALVGYFKKENVLPIIK